MSKRLLIEMPDGFIWQVPLDFIAASKVSVYFEDTILKEILADEKLTDVQKLESIHKKSSDSCESELLDEDALILWGRDNLEWKDVVRFATVFSAPDTSDTYTAGWKSGSMKTIEVDDELEKQAMSGVM